MENNKFAYLIMAHKNDDTFQKLLSLLDDERNDIYIHVDKKSDMSSFIDSTVSILHSEIYFTDRIDVEWGAYSQIEAEICLFKAASKHNYQFYHLISGADLPIKSQDEIHEFFEKNRDKEFVKFENNKFLYHDRVSLYYFFQKNLRDQSFETIVNKLLNITQNLFKVKRNRAISFQKGTQWVSITGELVTYIISKEEWIKRVFSHTLCSDEIFIQTLVHNSTYFKNRLYRKYYDNDACANQRLIDWNRGTPYVFRKDDLDELLNSPFLFARKFDPVIDKEIIELIVTKFG